MQSLFLLDCCSSAYSEGSPEESKMHDIQTLRQVMGGRMIPINEPMSPQTLDRMDKSRFGTPQRLARPELPRCPDAPRKKQREFVDYDDDQIIHPTLSFSSGIPVFPFEGLQRMDSMSSTTMELLPKFNEQVLIESLNQEHAPILIEPDEEREPVQIEDEAEGETRQDEPDVRQG